MEFRQAYRFFNWFLIAVLTYVLISSINMIGEGLNSVSGEFLDNLFEFATNPILGLFFGLPELMIYIFS